MPTFNSAETLAETLASLITTSRSEASQQVDLVILDGGSTDLTRSICRHYRRQRPNLQLHSLPGTHPGERVNQFIEACPYDYALICHSDDIYDADARLQVLEEMVELGHWLRGSMHGFYQSPLDALLQQKRNPYTGYHCNYPMDPITFRAEIPLWWSVSLNTVCYDLQAIARSGIRYDWQRYSYAADYYFHYQLSQHGPCASSPRITTITRHDSRSDGPANASALQRESREIRARIAAECGLARLGLEAPPPPPASPTLHLYRGNGCGVWGQQAARWRRLGLPTARAWCRQPLEHLRVWTGEQGRQGRQLPRMPGSR